MKICYEGKHDETLPFPPVTTVCSTSRTAVVALVLFVRAQL